MYNDEYERVLFFFTSISCDHLVVVMQFFIIIIILPRDAGEKTTLLISSCCRNGICFSTDGTCTKYSTV